MRVIEIHRGHFAFGGISFPTEVRQRFPDDAMEIVVRTEKVSFDENAVDRFAIPEGMGG